jgi:hypothetical protein
VIKKLTNIEDYSSIIEANTRLYGLLLNNKIKTEQLPLINTMIKLTELQLKTLEQQRKYDINGFDETKLMILPIEFTDLTIDDEINATAEIA